MENTVSRKDVLIVIGLIVIFFGILPLALYGLSEARQAAEAHAIAEIVDSISVDKQAELTAVAAAVTSDQVSSLTIGGTPDGWNWYQPVGKLVSDYRQTNVAITEFCDGVEKLIPETDDRFIVQACSFEIKVKDGWVFANSASLRPVTEPMGLESLALNQWAASSGNRTYTFSTIVQDEPAILLKIVVRTADRY